MHLDTLLCTDNSATTSFADQIPELHSSLENAFFKLDLNPKDGSIHTLAYKKDDVRLHLSQKFMGYDGKIQTNSGLYVFNPHQPAVDYS